MVAPNYVINEATIHNIIKILCQKEDLIGMYNDLFILQRIGDRLINIANNILSIIEIKSFNEANGSTTPHGLIVKGKLVLNKLHESYAEGVLMHIKPELLNLLQIIRVEINSICKDLQNMFPFYGFCSFDSRVITFYIVIMYSVYESFFDKSELCLKFSPFERKQLGQVLTADKRDIMMVVSE